MFNTSSPTGRHSSPPPLVAPPLPSPFTAQQAIAGNISTTKSTSLQIPAESKNQHICFHHFWHCLDPEQLENTHHSCLLRAGRVCCHGCSRDSHELGCKEHQMPCYRKCNTQLALLPFLRFSVAVINMGKPSGKPWLEQRVLTISNSLLFILTK